MKKRIHIIGLLLPLWLLGCDGDSSETVDPVDEFIEEIDFATSSSDDGDNVAENAVDDDFATYWGAEGEDGSQWLQFYFDESTTLYGLEIAFYQGDQAVYYFELESSEDGETWEQLHEGTLSSSGSSTELESFDFDSVTTAQYFRIVGYGNSADSWNLIAEVEFTDTLSVDVDYGLDPDLAPGENFDLSTWYLSIPTDTDNSGTADSIKGDDLDDYEDEYFYTGDDGGMVFVCPVEGYKTSTNTSYTRVELREMVEGGDNTNTKDLSNNWAFSTNEDSDFLDEVGAIDGTLTATLAVNYVTTTGDASKRGRVIIGQIHAPDDEPIRLYYHKTPDNENGAIYFAHEPESSTGLDEEYIFLYGDSRSSSMDNPENGIPLDEVFSYTIDVVGNILTVTISRTGYADVTEQYDMSDSGYNASGQYMYFKAGLYNQHSTDYNADEDDYAKVTFYALENTHPTYNLD